MSISGFQALQYSQGINNLQPGLSQGNETPVSDGALYWNGGMFSNMRSNKLQSNQFPDALNMDIDQLGQVTTRRGVIALGNSPASAYVQGLAYYNTPTQSSLFQVQGGTLSNYSSGTAWNVVAGYTSSSVQNNVNFVQLINNLYWVDGNGPMYRYDGTNVTAGTSGNWSPTTVWPPVGLQNLCVHQNRIVAWGQGSNPQVLYVSDILADNFTATNQIQIGTGDGDNIVGCLSWIQFLLLVFKQRSVWIVDFSTGSAGTDFGATVTITRLHNRIGCGAARSIAQIGADKLGQDVYFLARDGVRTVQTTIQDGNQGICPPISYSINDWIQRINWSAINTVTSIYWNNRYMLSVPIDSSQTPNYVFVYNVINQGWSGYWTGWNATQFTVSGFGQTPQLVFGDANGNVMEWLDYVSIIDESSSDFQDNGNAIPSSFTTKAFTFNQWQNNKLGYNVECEFNDSAATASINASLDGNNFTTLISSFNTSSNPGFTFPITPPFTIKGGTIVRAEADLLSVGEFREIEIMVSAPSGKIALKTVNVMAYLRLPQTQNF